MVPDHYSEGCYFNDKVTIHHQIWQPDRQWRSSSFQESKKCAYHVTLTLSTPWMHADLESIVCKFGGDPAICLRDEAICAKVYTQTDDGRRAIALAHSWNELKIIENTLTLTLTVVLTLTLSSFLAPTLRRIYLNQVCRTSVHQNSILIPIKTDC